MLARELALASVDVSVVERREGQDLAASRAGGLHSRTIEVLDQRGIAERFLAQGQVARVAWTPLDVSDFPTRHNYGLALWQNHIERILAEWVAELAVQVHRGRNDRRCTAPGPCCSIWARLAASDITPWADRVQAVNARTRALASFPRSGRSPLRPPC
jgi:hypothetical protein